MTSNIESIASKTSEKDFEFKKPHCRRVPRSFMPLLRNTPPQEMQKLWKVHNSYNYHSLDIRMINAYLKIDGKSVFKREKCLKTFRFGQRKYQQMKTKQTNF